MHFQKEKKKKSLKKKFPVNRVDVDSAIILKMCLLVTYIILKKKADNKDGIVDGVDFV